MAGPMDNEILRDEGQLDQDAEQTADETVTDQGQLGGSVTSEAGEDAAVYEEDLLMDPELADPDDMSAFDDEV